jgi:hypothetical protein
MVVPARRQTDCENAVKSLAFTVVKKERMEVDRSARLGELETVPEVLEAHAFLDYDLEPSFSALDEELVERDGILQQYAML